MRGTPILSLSARREFDGLGVGSGHDEMAPYVTHGQSGHLLPVCSFIFALRDNLIVFV